MVTQKEKGSMEILHVDQTVPIKAVDVKLNPLRRRHDELFAKAHRWRGLLNPHVDLAGEESEYLEARIELPGAEIELSKLKMEIGKLERERVRVRQVEVEKTERALDSQEEEILKDLDAAFEKVEALNYKLLNVEEARGRLGCHPTIDFKGWPEFMPNSPNHTPRVHWWRESLRENGRLK